MFKLISAVLGVSLATVAFAQSAKQPIKDEKPASRKALIVLTSHGRLGDTGKTTGFYLSEASHPWEVFTKAGYTVDFASVEGGKPPMDGVKMDDAVNKAFLEDPAVKTKLEKTLRPEDLQVSEYTIIFFAGGHGTMWDFPDNSTLNALTSNMYERGGVVAAVCHGPAALVNVKLSDGTYLVKGKTVSAFTNDEEKASGAEKVVPFLLEDRLVARGATFKKSANFEKHVEVSDRLVTGQNPASAKGVAEEAVKLAGK